MADWGKKFLSEKWEWSAKKSMLQRSQSSEKEAHQSAEIQVRSSWQSCWIKFFVEVKKIGKASDLCAAQIRSRHASEARVLLHFAGKMVQKKGITSWWLKVSEHTKNLIRGQDKIFKVFSDQKVPGDRSSGKSNSTDIQSASADGGWMGTRQLPSINNFTWI